MRLITFAAAFALSLSTAAVSTPRISSVAPTSVRPGPAAQQLTVMGEGFMAKLSLRITNPAGSTQIYKDTDVQSQEEASFRVAAVLPVAGVYSLVVMNPDGGVSQPFRLELREAGPAVTAETAQSAPVISAITPSKTSKQSQPQSLHLDGSHFLQGLTVTLNDPVGGALVVSGNGITNLTPNGLTFSAIIAVEGEYTVSVTNPDGKSSNAVSLSVGRR